MIWDFFAHGEPGQLLRHRLRPPRVRDVARRAAVRAHAGRGGRRVPLRRGRLLRLEDDGRRRVDAPPARRRRPGDGLQRHRPRPLLDEVRPREAGLHDRHLGLPGGRRVDADLPAVGHAPRRPRPDEVRRHVRRQHRLRGVLRLPRRDAGARRPARTRRAASASARRTSARASTAWPGPAPTSATGSPRTRRSSATSAWTSGRRSRSRTPTRSTAGSPTSRRRRSSRTYQRIRGVASARLARGVVRDLPAVREGLRRALRDVAVRERRRLADLRGRARPRRLRPRLRGYGADILSRVLDLAKKHGDHVWFAYTGAYPPTPEPTLTPVDLSRHANMDTGGQGAPGVPGWMATMPDDHMASLPDRRADPRRHPVPGRRPGDERPARGDRRLAPARLPGARRGPARPQGRLDLRAPHHGRQRQHEARGRDHVRLRGRHGRDAVRRARRQRRALVVPVARREAGRPGTASRACRRS